MWFIDKLNVQQRYDFKLPVIGEHGVLRYDLATGETISDSPKSKLIEGSYSSAITIRCNGSCVAVTGNPSRFNRPENVFGFSTFKECIDVYNLILAKFDLPQLTKSTYYNYLQSPDGTKAQIACDGAMIDHIDFTRNFSVGCGAEHRFIKALSGHKISRGQEPYLYPNGKSVDWYKGSEYLYKKVYVKSADLINHKRKRLKGVSKEDVEYYEKLIDWCNEIGMLREEHSFKQTFLRRKKHCFYGLTKEKDFLPYLKDIENVIERFTVMNTQYETIADRLIEEKIVKSKQAANATQCVYLKWIHGDNLEIGKSQFYTHRKRLCSIGIDISMPHDITRMPIQIRKNDLVDVKAVTPPDWYQMPITKPHLTLVA